MGANGAVTVLSKSITPYQFSSEGMIKAASRQQPQHHYRVRRRGAGRARSSGTRPVCHAPAAAAPALTPAPMTRRAAHQALPCPARPAAFPGV